MIIDCNGVNVDLTNKIIILPAMQKELDMTAAMKISRLYQRLSTFELIQDNATEELSSIEAWNTACVVREVMNDQNLSEEEALEEVCPNLVKLS